MKLKPTLGEVYSGLEWDIQVVESYIEKETDEVTKNELRELRGHLKDALFKARVVIDRKLTTTKPQ